MLDKFESPVDDIAEDGDATMWFAAGDGYIRTSPTDSDDPEDEILEDDLDYLWMSCTKGIFRVAKQQLREVLDGEASRLTCVSYGRARSRRRR